MFHPSVGKRSGKKSTYLAAANAILQGTLKVDLVVPTGFCINISFRNVGGKGIPR